jgi:phosphoadenosine phosphosulfate reductase
MLKDILDRHRLVVLEFSGGKDSLACLYLLRNYLNKIAVLWLNTGDAAPETVEQMEGIKAWVPNFLEVRSNVVSFIKRNGYPSDVLSVWDTPFGNICRRDRSQVNLAIACCAANLWAPMHDIVKTYGFTLVIRGQRRAEEITSPIVSGHIEDGVEYLFPIEDWSEADVKDYLDALKVPLPANYGYFNSSMDCMHCTGYLSENYGKLQYLSEKHPEVGAEVVRRLKYIRNAANAELRHLDKVLENHA